ncbi:MAG: sterol desaturase family protein [Candidatus Azotimanducaceae bacterium]
MNVGNRINDHVNAQHPLDQDTPSALNGLDVDTQDLPDIVDPPAYVYRSKLTEFLWTLPQPIIALTSMIAVAIAISNNSMTPEALSGDADALTALLLFSPLFLLLAAERIWTKKKAWLLNWRDYAEDAFWLFTAAYIWIPLISDYYETPISSAFEWVRENTFIPFTLEAATIPGLILCAVIVQTTSEFIYYWIHRCSHRYMIAWRTHATHHHITKMSAARSNRTHPTEFLALSFSTPIILALFGASTEVIAVSAALGFCNGWITHSNLPMRSGVWNWFFTSPEHHQLHHSHNFDDSNTNFGCGIIIWDRIFGTFSNSSHIERCGSGTGKQLNLFDQYVLAFYSNDKLKQL